MSDELRDDPQPAAPQPRAPASTRDAAVVLLRQRLGEDLPPPHAAGLSIAALRETFEGAGRYRAVMAG